MVANPPPSGERPDLCSPAEVPLEQLLNLSPEHGVGIIVRRGGEGKGGILKGTQLMGGAEEKMVYDLNGNGGRRFVE